MAVLGRAPEIKTPLCRFAFTNGLWTIQTTDSGKKQWNCSLLFPKGSDISMLHANALEAAEQAWPGKAAQMLKDEIIKNPFLDGDGKQGRSKKSGEPHAGFPGTTFIRVQSGEDFRPRLFNRKLLPATKEELYSGAYGYAVINAFAWNDPKQGNGISFGVSMLQVAKDGERLGGGGASDPETHFEKIADEGDAPAETKGGAGAAGLFS